MHSSFQQLLVIVYSTVGRFICIHSCRLLFWNFFFFFLFSFISSFVFDLAVGCCILCLLLEDTKSSKLLFWRDSRSVGRLSFTRRLCGSDVCTPYVCCGKRNKTEPVLVCFLFFFSSADRLNLLPQNNNNKKKEVCRIKLSNKKERKGKIKLKKATNCRLAQLRSQMGNDVVL